MAYRKRHNLYELGAVTAGSTTAAIQIGEVTKGIVYVERSASGTVASVQVSPDGTNWHDLYDRAGNQVTHTLGGSVTKEAFMIEVSAEWLRIGISTQNAAAVWFEGVREIG